MFNSGKPGGGGDRGFSRASRAEIKRLGLAWMLISVAPTLGLAHARPHTFYRLVEFGQARWSMRTYS